MAALAVAVSIVSVLGAGAALADTDGPYTASFPSTEPDWSTTLAVPQFDPALGDLVSATVTLDTTVSGDMAVENLATESPGTGNVTLQAEVTLALQADPSVAVPPLLPTAIQEFTLEPCDTVLPDGTCDPNPDFAGPAGLSVAGLSGDATDTVVFTDAGALALFTGTGDVVFDAAASALSTGIQDTGNVFFEFSTFASAEVTVTYEFNAPGIDIEKATNGMDADGANDADVPQIAAGDPVTWTYVVTNTGDVAYQAADVTVTDSVAGVTPVLDPASDAGADGVLSPGESWTYTAQGVAEDLASLPLAPPVVSGCNPDGTAVPGDRATYENIGTVTVPDDSDTDPSHYCNPPAPGIDIEKATNGMDADGANDADVPQIAPGDPVTWTYVVTNIGAEPYAEADVTVTDSVAGVTPVLDPASDAGADGVLSPGESWTYTAQGVAEDLASLPLAPPVVSGCNPDGTAVPGDRATYENIGTVTVPDASDTDPSHYCNPPVPAIDIDKTPDEQTLLKGETANFTITVTNIGPVDLINVEVTDPLAPDCDAVIGDLATGASTTYDCSLDDVTEGFTNVATVTGEDEQGTEVTDSDPADVFVVLPQIDIVKSPDHQAINLGSGDQTANFTITVTNPGPVDLINVTVTDPLAPDCDAVIGDLAVGESTTYSCARPNVTTGFTNVATTNGTDRAGNPVSDSDTAVVVVQLVPTGSDTDRVAGFGATLLLLGAALLLLERRWARR